MIESLIFIAIFSALYFASCLLILFIVGFTIWQANKKHREEFMTKIDSRIMGETND